MATTHALSEAAPAAGPALEAHVSSVGSRGRALACLALVVAGGLVLRGYQLSARSFWFDEAFSWRLTQCPIAEVVARTARDNHPPLYFLLLKLWAAVFGDSPLALRSLSVVFGGLTIIGMYLLVHEALGRRAQAAALVVAALVAVSAFQIRWSWEVRMYTLGTALAAFSSWALFGALHASGRLRPWLRYGLLALLFAYTHYYALFSLAAQGLFLLGYLLVRSRGSLWGLMREPALQGALLAGVVVAVGWAPWLPVFLRQRSQVQMAFWTQPVSGWDVPIVCYEMFVAPENAVVTRGQALLAGVFCAAGLLTLLWKARLAEWYVFTAAVVPFVLSVLISSWDTKVFHLRYFLFAHLFFLAAGGLLLARIPSPADRTIASALALGSLLWVYADLWNKLDIANKPGARAAADWIAAQRQSQEPVIVSSPWLYLPMLYHAHDRRGWLVYHEGKEVVHYHGAAVIGLEDLIDSQRLRALRSSRVWVVDMGFGGWRSDVVRIPAHWVLKDVRVFPEVYQVQGQIVVTEYDARPGGKAGH